MNLDRQHTSHRPGAIDEESPDPDRRVLEREARALGVHVVQAVVRGFGDVDQLSADIVDTGVRDDDVEPTKAGASRLQQRLDLAGLGYVSSDVDRPGTGALAATVSAAPDASRE
jgi:hypothetical protein